MLQSKYDELISIYKQESKDETTIDKRLYEKYLFVKHYECFMALYPFINQSSNKPINQSVLFVAHLN